MTQEQALREAKDRVAKKHGYPKWGALLSHFVDEDSLTTQKFLEMENEAMLEYSSSKDKEIEREKNLHNADLAILKEIHTKMVAYEKEKDLLKSQLSQATASSSSGERGDGECKCPDCGTESKSRSTISYCPKCEKDFTWNKPLPHPSTKEFRFEAFLKWLKEIESEFPNAGDALTISIKKIREKIQSLAPLCSICDDTGWYTMIGEWYQRKCDCPSVQSLTPSSHTEVKDKPKGEGRIGLIYFLASWGIIAANQKD